MAKSYKDFKDLMASAKLDFGSPFKRSQPIPLDYSSVYGSLADAQNYASTNPTAYVGQVLTVVTTTPELCTKDGHTLPLADVTITIGEETISYISCIYEGTSAYTPCNRYGQPLTTEEAAKLPQITQSTAESVSCIYKGVTYTVPHISTSDDGGMIFENTTDNVKIVRTRRYTQIATTYVIDNEYGDLKEVGSVPVGDNTTITVDETGKISVIIDGEVKENDTGLVTGGQIYTAINDKIGEIPSEVGEIKNISTVKEYVDAKTHGIASSGHSHTTSDITDFDDVIAAAKVAEATKATQDGDGNVISTTYIKKDGHVLTDNNYTTAEKTKLAGIATGATKVEASTNGKIKINGTETTVYTHPEKHASSDISDFNTAVAAIKVTNAANADNATHATSADTATNTTNAANADNAAKLGGKTTAEITAEIKEAFTGTIADNNTGFVTGDAVYDVKLTADAAKARIDAFIDGADNAADAIDTLVEIQQFMTDDTGAFVALSTKVTDIETGKKVVPKATHAVNADEAGHATSADSADYAAEAGHADSADEATHAGSADNATKAADSDKLGGKDPTFYATADSVTDITKAGGAIDTKIAALDVTVTGMGAGKTIKTLTETDGKIAAEFQDIAITKSQITDFEHNHDATYVKRSDMSKYITEASPAYVNILKLPFPAVDSKATDDEQALINLWQNSGAIQVPADYPIDIDNIDLDTHTVTYSLDHYKSDNESYILKPNTSYEIILAYPEDGKIRETKYVTSDNAGYIFLTLSDNLFVRIGEDNKGIWVDFKDNNYEDQRANMQNAEDYAYLSMYINQDVALNIEKGAQVNTIETIKVNGTALDIENKAVDITIPDAYTKDEVDTIIQTAVGDIDFSSFVTKDYIEGAICEDIAFPVEDVDGVLFGSEVKISDDLLLKANTDYKIIIYGNYNGQSFTEESIVTSSAGTNTGETQLKDYSITQWSPCCLNISNNFDMMGDGEYHGTSLSTMTPEGYPELTGDKAKYAEAKIRIVEIGLGIERGAQVNKIDSVSSNFTIENKELKLASISSNTKIAETEDLSLLDFINSQITNANLANEKHTHQVADIVGLKEYLLSDNGYTEGNTIYEDITTNRFSEEYFHVVESGDGYAYGTGRIYMEVPKLFKSDTSYCLQIGEKHYYGQVTSLNDTTYFYPDEFVSEYDSNKALFIIDCYTDSDHIVMDPTDGSWLGTTKIAMACTSSRALTQEEYNNTVDNAITLTELLPNLNLATKTVATTTDIGLVKSTAATVYDAQGNITNTETINKVNVGTDGTMTVNAISVDKLENNGYTLVLFGGNAAGN